MRNNLEFRVKLTSALVLHVCRKRERKRRCQSRGFHVRAPILATPLRTERPRAALDRSAQLAGRDQPRPHRPYMIKSKPLHPRPFEPCSPQYVWRTRFKDKCVYTGCGVGLPGRIDSDRRAGVHATKRALETQLVHVRLSQCHEVFVRTTTAALITVHHFLSQAAERDAVFFLCANEEVAGEIMATLNIDDIPA